VRVRAVVREEGGARVGVDILFRLGACLRGWILDEGVGEGVGGERDAAECHGRVVDCHVVDRIDLVCGWEGVCWPVAQGDGCVRAVGIGWASTAFLLGRGVGNVFVAGYVVVDRVFGGRGIIIAIVESGERGLDAWVSEYGRVEARGGSGSTVIAIAIAESGG
jgi:hypothetical protein